MEFFLESVSSFGVRCGKLISRTGAILETPGSLLYTRGAAVPYVPQDFLQQLLEKDRGEDKQSHGVHITLPTLYEHPGTEALQAFKCGIHKFANFNNQFVYLSVQDPVCPPPDGYNQEKSASIWTLSGRQKVSVESYLDFVKACKPDAFESLCETLPVGVTSLKRIKKSVDRTLKFLDQTLEMFEPDVPVFGAIQGNDIVSERKRSARETSNRPVSGFILEGFDQEDHRVKEMTLETTVELPSDKPRILTKITSPIGVFDAIEAGIDLLDGCYPYVLSEKGHAVWLSKENELVQFKPKEEEFQFGDVIDLNERVFSSQHNLHQYLKFFSDLRKSLKDGKYVQFKNLFHQTASVC